MFGKCTLCTIALVLLIIGGLNWGLVGLGGFLGRDLNVVEMLLGQWDQVVWVIYILVGLAAVVKLFGSKCPCSCNTDGGMMRKM